MTERWVLFTGLVRVPDEFQAKLNTVSRWMEEGLVQGLVFSTWIGEVEQYPELRARLLEMGATIVESVPPRIRTVGHALHQMQALQLGLRAIPPRAFVMKTRSDMNMLVAQQEELLRRGPQPLSLPPRWPAVFGHRVAVADSFIFSPFYTNDIQFFGMREDLLKIPAFDMALGLYSSCIGTEQWLHAMPFLNSFPLLRQFLAFQPGLLFGRDAETKALCRTLLDHAVTRQSLFTSLLILKHYYEFIYDSPSFLPAPPELEFEGLFTEGYLHGLRPHMSACQPTVSATHALDALLRGRFRCDGEDLDFSAEVTRLRDYTLQRQWAAASLPESEDDPWMQVAAQMSRIVGQPVGRRYEWLREGNGRVLRDHTHPAQMQSLDGDSQMAALRDELQSHRDLHKRLLDKLAARGITP